MEDTAADAVGMMIVVDMAAVVAVTMTGVMEGEWNRCQKSFTFHYNTGWDLILTY